jgi:uncharacterized protein YnzC (UPF0291/DUF896 family)
MIEPKKITRINTLNSKKKSKNRLPVKLLASKKIIVITEPTIAVAT